ncbi:hypothetical protein GCM10009533_03390 [Saccharopolyspora spinosporotrichia]|uniref:Uncharacterized protein n=1 Tax=Saccharopolyspora erythraea TaxID=1836 RepID=A0ABP3LWG6_SACER|nr:hypothetical protein N599_24130 [Saccharopolyspora erythraea D]
MPGEGFELLVQRRPGQAVGQRRHRVGADAQHHLQGVLRGVALRQEGPQRVLGHFSRGRDDFEGEDADRVEPAVAERSLLAQRRDELGAGTERGQLGGVHGDADVAAVAGRDGEDQDLAGERVQGRRLEHRAGLEEAVEQVR